MSFDIFLSTDCLSYSETWISLRIIIAARADTFALNLPFTEKPTSLSIFATANYILI